MTTMKKMIIYCVRFLKIVEGLKIKKDNIYYYKTGGILNVVLENYELAISYLEDGLELYKRLDLPKEQMAANNNIGYVYNKMGKNEEAISYLMKALELDENDRLSKGSGLKMTLLTNIGEALIKTGELEKGFDYLSRASYYDKGEFYRDYRIALKINLGNYYEISGDYTLAISEYKTALITAESYNMIHRKQELYLLLSNLLYKQEHFQLSSDYLFKYKDISTQLMSNMHKVVLSKVDTEILLNKTIKEATNLRIQNELFEKENNYDYLTGAHSRKFIIEYLNDYLQESNKIFSVVMIDLDDFKSINDTYGHLVGDTILYEISDTILKSLKPGQILGRVGGDEFLICLSDLNKEEALAKVTQIKNLISNLEVVHNGITIKTTVSMGISDNEGIEPHELAKLIQNADSALYRAKSLGKNKIC